MAEPLDVTIDKMTAQYHALRQRCESTRTPKMNDVAELKKLIVTFREWGLKVQEPDYCASASWSGVPDIKDSDCVTIRDVIYRGQICDVVVTNQPISENNVYVKKEITKYPDGIIGRMGIPDAEIILQTARALHHSTYALGADRQQKEFAYNFAKRLQEGCATSTTISLDRIIHQHGTAQERSVAIDLSTMTDGVLSEQECADSLSLAISGMQFEEMNRVMGDFGTRTKERDTMIAYIRRSLLEGKHEYLVLRTPSDSFYGSSREMDCTVKLSLQGISEKLYGFTVLPHGDAP